MKYGLQPDNFKAAFNNVTAAVRAVTNSTFMLWSPNIASGSVDSLQGYTQYEPAQYDLAGLSYYAYSGSNVVPDSGSFASNFQSF